MQNEALPRSELRHKSVGPGGTYTSQRKERTMYRCETCGEEFEAPMILDRSDPRPDCFFERFRKVGCPYCGSQYFNELDEEGEEK